jgi:hypothetical protein
MHGWFAGAGGAGHARFFQEDYHCYSVAYADKTHLEVCLLAWRMTFIRVRKEVESRGMKNSPSVLHGVLLMIDSLTFYHTSSTSDTAHTL